MINPTQAQLDAGFAAVRDKVDESFTGRELVTDDMIRDIVSVGAYAILNAPGGAEQKG